MRKKPRVRIVVCGWISSEKVLQTLIASLEKAMHGKVVEVQRCEPLCIGFDAVGPLDTDSMRTALVAATRAGSHDITVHNTTTGENLSHLVT